MKISTLLLTLFLALGSASVFSSESSKDAPIFKDETSLCNKVNLSSEWAGNFEEDGGVLPHSSSQFGPRLCCNPILSCCTPNRNYNGRNCRFIPGGPCA